MYRYRTRRYYSVHHRFYWRLPLERQGFLDRPMANKFSFSVSDMLQENGAVTLSLLNFLHCFSFRQKRRRRKTLIKFLFFSSALQRFPAKVWETLLSIHHTFHPFTTELLQFLKPIQPFTADFEVGDLRNCCKAKGFFFDHLQPHFLNPISTVQNSIQSWLRQTIYFRDTPSFARFRLYNAYHYKLCPTYRSLERYGSYS